MVGLPTTRHIASVKHPGTIQEMRVRSHQCFRNRTGYIAADSTPAITPAAVPTAPESVTQCAATMTKVVPPTTAAMNAMIRTGSFGLLGPGGMDPTLRR